MYKTNIRRFLKQREEDIQARESEPKEWQGGKFSGLCLYLIYSLFVEQASNVEISTDTDKSPIKICSL